MSYMRKCLVCDSNDFTEMYNSTLLRCNTCSFTSANMEISEAELKAIYSENYFKGDEYLDYLADKVAIQKNFSKRLKQIEVNEKDGAIKALEIGCAYGFFGDVFTHKFKGAEYLGVDVVPEAINYGKGTLQLNLALQDYLTLANKEKYSHVFMWDVIEHLREPGLFIQKVSQELQKGGELHITTGDIGAGLPKLQKENWRMIHPPTHLHYFSKKTITRLLTEHGFNIKSVRYDPIYRSVKQIFYSIFLLNKPKRGVYQKIFETIPANWFIPMNTYDIMHVIALKK
jgi:2-polyprenyl-3-methyl-5-hydroxy-6-metoxy-1,4-benzoquinol methylase